MEERMVKYFSKESNAVAIHAANGHFATINSHINYYIDVTSLKSRVKEAREVAKLFRDKITMPTYVDTIVCMDGTKMIGAFLAEEFEEHNYLSTNAHETIYVISPEEKESQIILRDNNRGAVAGKHVVIMVATSTTGDKIRRTMEAIRYYGGTVEAIASIFSTFDEIDGMEVQHIFDQRDLLGYAAYRREECPYCKKGMKVEALVNGFGYSTIY